MPTTSLTDRTLKTLPTPEAGQVTYWDSALSGFGVRVSQGGAKSFVVVYGPNRTRKTIGRYPTISLKQARDKAKELKAAFVLGLDRKKTITWADGVIIHKVDRAARNPRDWAMFSELPDIGIEVFVATEIDRYPKSCTPILSYFDNTRGSAA